MHVQESMRDLRMSGAEIKAWREEHGLTQGAMAELLGLKSGATSISAWENDRATPQPYLRPALEKLGAEIRRNREEMDARVSSLAAEAFGSEE